MYLWNVDSYDLSQYLWQALGVYFRQIRKFFTKKYIKLRIFIHDRDIH